MFSVVCIAAQLENCGFVDRVMFPGIPYGSRQECQEAGKRFGNQLKLPSSQWVVLCAEGVLYEQEGK